MANEDVAPGDGAFRQWSTRPSRDDPGGPLSKIKSPTRSPWIRVLLLGVAFSLCFIQIHSFAFAFCHFVVWNLEASAVLHYIRNMIWPFFFKTQNGDGKKPDIMKIFENNAGTQCAHSMFNLDQKFHGLWGFHVYKRVQNQSRKTSVIRLPMLLCSKNSFQIFIKEYLKWN